MANVRADEEILHSRQVAEAARETEWKGAGFLRELFLGRLRLELVQQVATASRDQAEGVAEIQRTMSTMDEVTQRNASAAEQLSASAEELRGQATTLQELVAFFHAGEPLRYPRPAAERPPGTPIGAVAAFANAAR